MHIPVHLWYINKVAAETAVNNETDRTLKTEQRVNVLVETIMVETKQTIRWNRNNASIEMSVGSF
ncbi:hypothetical protein DUZ99_08900 [Xylanibacillus composti]|nr:hypothetical protein [Xylanibacillus composti]